MKLERTLALTSPRMKGKDVEHAQRVLTSQKTGTPFGNFHPGEIDGVYGANSHAATKRAKFWLGYPEDEINGRYNQQIEDYLIGDEKLPADYKRRRDARIKKAQETPLRLRAFKKAKEELGTVEKPRDSNIVKYSTWYGIRGPWCAMFVTWCYVQAGSKQTFAKGNRYAFVPFLVQDARGRDFHLVKLGKDEVRQGDIVCFDWEGGGMNGNSLASDHVGLFDKWISKSAGTFKTIEGNTAVGNDSNGGEVMRRDRNMSQVSCFARTEV